MAGNGWLGDSVGFKASDELGVVEQEPGEKRCVMGLMNNSMHREHSQHSCCAAIARVEQSQARTRSKAGIAGAVCAIIADMEHGHQALRR